MTRSERGSAEKGFTLLELMIVASILAIIASIGVPQYVSALRTARNGKAKHELQTISHQIDSYAAANGGQLPLTLHQVGFGGKRDPWGVPYCYLNYGDGTGDGLQWAIEAGLVDPSAVKGYSPSSGGGSTGGGGAPSAGPAPMRGGSFLPFSPASAAPARRTGDGARVPQGDDTGPIAVSGRAEARALATSVADSLPRVVPATEVDDLAGAIASSLSFSIFVGVPVASTRRCDRFMYPLNTDYDLFSLGPNGRTAVSLGEAVGQDDVIRANNGGFFGVASDY
ncbi:MAG: type II secretion system protein [Planctomycetes bacterium]|nr:type II secretion system protein [Planctomycetota bacterium]